MVIRKHHPKTVMCEVTRRVVNSGKISKYPGSHAVRTNYMVHDPMDMCRVGDVVRIKHGKRFSKRKSHIVYDILRPFEPGVYIDQNPEYHMKGVSRKDRKKRDQTHEDSLKDNLTLQKLAERRDAKEKELVVERLLRQQRRKAARAIVHATAGQDYGVEEDTSITRPSVIIPTTTPEEPESPSPSPPTKENSA